MEEKERADRGLAFLLRYENVAWYEPGQVRILDRRVYPMETRFVVCNRHEEVAQAIADMVTQSFGPYQAAGMGLALAAEECRGMGEEEQRAYLKAAAYTLTHARPTTVKAMEAAVAGPLEAALAALERGKDTAQAAFDQAVCEVDSLYRRYIRVGELLASKFPKGGTVMTQCYAEIYVGMMLRACREAGNDVKVICPETRPYYQGARLTASCVKDMGFDVTVITDNMPGYVMKKKGVDVFTSAADVITMDGYIVNKIGTFQIALCAHHWGIPYLVTGRPDRGHPTIDTVTIEERDPNLAVESLGQRLVMEGVKGYYPAFDITPPHLCSGVVTDQGILSPFDLCSYDWNK